MMLFRNMFFISSNRSNKWKKVREDHIKKQPFCQACGRNTNLEVHHIEPVSINPDRELDPENLITLCSKYCHLVFGHFMDYNSWNPNVKEDCGVYYNKVLNKPIKLETQNDKNTFFDNIIHFFRDWVSGWHNRSK